jgi:hypothetical protein
MRIAYASGYDSLHLKDAMTLNGRVWEDETRLHHRLLDMLNAKYLVSLQPLENAGRFEFLRDSRPGALYRNGRVLPRAFLVPEAEYLDRDATLNKITDGSFEPLRRVYVDTPIPESTPPTRPDPAPASPEAVRITRYTLSSVDMQVDSSKAQWLFFSDMFYPGWKARVNGRPARIHRANYCFRALAVPAGLSEVRWNYDPILFRIGCMISLLTVFVLLVCAVRAP